MNPLLMLVCVFTSPDGLVEQYEYTAREVRLNTMLTVADQIADPTAACELMGENDSVSDLDLSLADTEGTVL